MGEENENPGTEPEPESEPVEIKEDKCVDETPDEDNEILREIIAERKAVNDAVDKILEDFQKGDNSPEYRKTVARKIVNVVNRRGFPAGSIFQI